MAEASEEVIWNEFYELVWWRKLDVLLLPGMDGTGQLHARLMRALPKAWRVVALEYPSEVVAGYDELQQRVRVLAPERPFFLVAESYSTPLAIHFATSRPKHLTGLVLCAGFASSPIRGWLRFLARCLSPLLFYLPMNRWVVKRFLLGKGAEKMLVDEVRNAIATVRTQVLAARLREILACDVVSDLARIDVPILYLHAEGDRVVGRHCLAEIEHHTSRLMIERIPGPHLLLQREPVLAADAIARFMDTL